MLHHAAVALALARVVRLEQADIRLAARRLEDLRALARWAASLLDRIPTLTPAQALVVRRIERPVLRPAAHRVPLLRAHTFRALSQRSDGSAHASARARVLRRADAVRLHVTAHRLEHRRAPTRLWAFPAGCDGAARTALAVTCVTTVVQPAVRLAAAYGLVGVRAHATVVGTLARTGVNDAAGKAVFVDALAAVLGGPLAGVGHAAAHGVVVHLARAGRFARADGFDLTVCAETGALGRLGHAAHGGHAADGLPVVAGAGAAGEGQGGRQGDEEEEKKGTGMHGEPGGRRDGRKEGVEEVGKSSRTER